MRSLIRTVPDPAPAAGRLLPDRGIFREGVTSATDKDMPEAADATRNQDTPTRF